MISTPRGHLPPLPYQDLPGPPPLTYLVIFTRVSERGPKGWWGVTGGAGAGAALGAGAGLAAGGAAAGEGAGAGAAGAGAGLGADGAWGGRGRVGKSNGPLGVGGFR
jgi:hypothetical protein